MYYEEMLLNPIVVEVAIVAILLLSFLLLMIYIPRMDELTRLQKENKKLRLEHAKMAEKLAVEVLAKNYIYSEYEELLSQKDGRIKQANKKAETFAVLCDKYKNGYSEEV